MGILNFFVAEILVGTWVLILSIAGVLVRNYRPLVEQKALDYLHLCTHFVLFLSVFLTVAGLSDGATWSVYFFTDLLVVNFGTQALKVVVLLSFIVVLLLSWDYLRFEYLKSLEYVVLSLFSLVAMLLLLSSNDLMVIYLLLEFQALSFYILAAYDVASLRSTESGLKYFLVGAVASILYLFGVSFIYFFFGTTNLSFLKVLVSCVVSWEPFVLVGFFLITVGFLFKIAIVPFHVWIADVYEGAVLSVTTLFAVVPKIVLLSVLARIFATFDVFVLEPALQNAFFLFSILSLLVGSLAALYQANLKRLIAYSAIVHASFLFLSMTIGTYSSLTFLFLYFFVYIILGLNVFSFFLSLRNFVSNTEFFSLRDLVGLYRSAPSLTFLLILNFFSLAGVPPLSGFFGKALVLFSLTELNYFLLAFVFVLFSAVSAFYYVRVVKVAVYETSELRLFLRPISRRNAYIIAFTSLLNLSLYIYLDNFIYIISHIVNSFF